MSKSFDLILSEQKESEEWYKKYCQLFRQGDYKGTVELLEQAEKWYISEYIVYRTIQDLMYSEAIVNKEKREKLINQLNEYDFIKEIKYVGSTVRITMLKNDVEKDIYACKLSDIIPELKEDGVETADRHGECHKSL